MITTPMSVDLDLPYGPAPEHRLDVYQRTGTTRPPAVVLVHGGGWFRGDRSKEQRLASLLAEAGYVVFVPDYRLAPAHPFPAGRDDVLAAAAWAHASGYAFDRDRVAFLGGSAGGNLAVEAGLSTGRPAASWSGIFNLQAFIEATDGTVAATPTGQDLDAMRSADINQTGRDDAFLRWCILQEVGGDRSLLPDASTVQHATANAGPVYLANSLAEFVPVSDPIAMQQALTAVGVASTLQLIPGTRHAEGYLDQAIAGTLAFLHDALAPGRQP
ncbi:alpha/beta hydrolase [Actinoplanes sp. NPDC048796]|uniref:alpha/beta hydrolase n=1 Tax=unclassified Actinoplanes TaxID=2626549 RepID=UPI0033DD8AA0